MRQIAETHGGAGKTALAPLRQSVRLHPVNPIKGSFSETQSSGARRAFDGQPQFASSQCCSRVSTLKISFTLQPTMPW